MTVDRKDEDINPPSALRLLGESDESPVTDRRLPARDIFAYLADIQMKRSDIERLKQHLRDSWPSVRAIHCSITLTGRIYFNIQIDPYSSCEIKRHTALLQWINENIPASRAIQMHFYSPLDKEDIPSCRNLYDADERIRALR